MSADKSIRPMRQDVLLLIDEIEHESSELWSPKSDPETGVIVAIGPDTYDVYVGQKVWWGVGDPGIRIDPENKRLRLVSMETIQGEVLE